MAFYYLETSALVKLYVREPGTERVLALATRSSENRLAILDLSQVELRSAIRRRERAGDIPTLAANELLATFKGHIEARFVIQKITDFVLRSPTSFWISRPYLWIVIPCERSMQFNWLDTLC